jgi:hypothetical protein
MPQIRAIPAFLLMKRSAMRKASNCIRFVIGDLETRKIYIFITNEFTLPSGLLGFIYKLRWDVEKAFDQVKNLFKEKKAWTTSEESKIQQAAFITLAHNLTLMMVREIEHREGIRDEKTEKRSVQL